MNYKGKKYMVLLNNNDFKKISLCDNVYFTLRDIFKNGDYETAVTANYYNKLLTNNIPYEKRTEGFIYTNVLENSVYINNLIKWLSEVTIHCRDVEYNIYDEEEYYYMQWADWWEQFEELKRELEEQQKKII